MRDTWLTGGSNPFKASNNLGADMITSADGNRNPSIIDINGNRRNPYVGGAISNVVGNTSLGSGGSGGSSGGGSGSGYSGYSYSSGPIGYNLDLSAFQKSRDAIIQGANNAKNMLKNQYDRLLAELDKKTKEGNEQFGRGRATISEDAYDRSRENLNSLAARGLAGSGLQQLGEVQERMETGQQMNDLASQYYAYLDDIDAQRREGEAQYNEGIQSIEDSLQQQLANIGLQEFQAQDDYNRYMSNLAMQMAEVQGYNAGRSIVQGNADNELAQALQAADTLQWQYNNGIIDEASYLAGLANIQGSASGLQGYNLNDWGKYILSKELTNQNTQSEPKLTKAQEQANFREWQNKNAQNISNVFSSIGNALNNWNSIRGQSNPQGTIYNPSSSYISATSPYYGRS